MFEISSKQYNAQPAQQTIKKCQRECYRQVLADQSLPHLNTSDKSVILYVFIIVGQKGLSQLTPI